MTRLRNAHTATVSATRPATRYGAMARAPLELGAAVELISFGFPADLVKGATILSATLRVYQIGAWSGTRTLSLTRNSTAWKVSQANWNNKPALVGSSVALVKGATADGAVWAFDVSDDMQSMVNGTVGKYGWRLTTSEAVRRYVRGAGASVNPPTLDVTYAYAPATPTDLHPSAGAVSVAKPRLRFNSGDFDSTQVWIDTAPVTGSPAFDSSWVTNSAEEYDLAASSFAGLANGDTRVWRVRVRKGAQTSAWSEWATMTRTIKPTITITDPKATIYESTPPFNATMTSPFTRVRWYVSKDGSSGLIYDSGVIPSTTGDVTPIKSVFTKVGASYTVTVRGYDNVLREETYGDPAYVQTSVTTTLIHDPGGPPVKWVDASQVTLAPWVDVRWGWTATSPDGWAVIRNGDVIQTFDLASDAAVGTGVYGWRDWTAPPATTLTYQVAPIINGVTSSSDLLTDANRTINTVIAGVWLGDPETGTDVLVLGKEEVSAVYAEEADTYNPIGSTTPVRVVTSMRGLEGDVSGLVTDAFDRLGIDEVETLFALKSQPGGVFRLAWGDANIPVRLSSVSPVPRRAGTSAAGGAIRAVTFSFAQVGELPFDMEP